METERKKMVQVQSSPHLTGGREPDYLAWHSLACTMSNFLSVFEPQFLYLYTEDDSCP